MITVGMIVDIRKDAAPLTPPSPFVTPPVDTGLSLRLLDMISLDLKLELNISFLNTKAAPQNQQQDVLPAVNTEQFQPAPEKGDALSHRRH